MVFITTRGREVLEAFFPAPEGEQFSYTNFGVNPLGTYDTPERATTAAKSYAAAHRMVFTPLVEGRMIIARIPTEALSSKVFTPRSRDLVSRAATPGYDIELATRFLSWEEGLEVVSVRPVKKN